MSQTITTVITPENVFMTTEDCLEELHGSFLIRGTQLQIYKGRMIKLDKNTYYDPTHEKYHSRDWLDNSLWLIYENRIS